MKTNEISSAGRKVFTLLTIGAIEDPHTIKQILDYLEIKARSVKPLLVPEGRGPPPDAHG